MKNNLRCEFKRLKLRMGGPKGLKLRMLPVFLLFDHQVLPATGRLQWPFTSWFDWCFEFTFNFKIFWSLFLNEKIRLFHFDINHHVKLPRQLLFNRCTKQKFKYNYTYTQKAHQTLFKILFQASCSRFVQLTLNTKKVLFFSYWKTQKI